MRRECNSLVTVFARKVLEHLCSELNLEPPSPQSAPSLTEDQVLQLRALQQELPHRKKDRLAMGTSSEARHPC